jgi:4,5-DOPA dioxygenase extradiol
MPALFVGHGSPMNAMEDNAFTRTWTELGKSLPRPEAILSVSAHWFTKGTWIADSERPKQIYDMYGFPSELYDVKYPATGSPTLAKAVMQRIDNRIDVDNSWGLDHGTWSVLCRMYPRADIPVVQLSIDATADPEDHFRMGRKLADLLEEGIMILGSGNIVHDLGKIDWNMEGGFPYAEEFDGYIKSAILQGEYDKAIQYQEAGPSAKLAFRTPEHYYPLLYVLGAASTTDRVSVFNEACIMGSISMTGYSFQ